ncbi:Ovarian cancer-associated protein 2 [Coemansia javaensis]|uniref:Ovarian cancer-associated protein 2 n=1 Tax=Coemansia javaensis TaxID=2761396 RepID=A0A9W8HCE9_9FUNG|nr:Ovarian cancer-associated protein 2 [Coemansia javaensis]
MAVDVPLDAGAPARRLRILCLHGYEEDSAVMRAKIRRHTEALQETADFGNSFPPQLFVDAPNTLRPYDIDGVDNMARAADARAGRTLGRTLRGWYWPRSLEPESVCGLEASIAHLESVLAQQGPFDGVFGFSQGNWIIIGGLMAGVLCALLEHRRDLLGNSSSCTHPALRFAVICSGYRLRDAAWAHLYAAPIRTPSLHVYGVLDSMIHVSRSIDHQAAFVQPAALSFLGTQVEAKFPHLLHFVPKSHEAVRTIQQFVERFSHQ